MTFDWSFVLEKEPIKIMLIKLIDEVKINKN